MEGATAIKGVASQRKAAVGPTTSEIEGPRPPVGAVLVAIWAALGVVAGTAGLGVPGVLAGSGPLEEVAVVAAVRKVVKPAVRHGAPVPKNGKVGGLRVVGGQPVPAAMRTGLAVARGGTGPRPLDVAGRTRL